jgi:hypothetical protein
MKRVFVLGLAVAMLGSLSAAIGAHHGGAAFDQNQVLTFKGTVTEMTFTNPHVLVYWDVTKDGATEKWSGWLTAPTKLARAGWTKSTLKPGDQIEVTGTPHKGGSHILQIRKLVAPDGKALPLSENQ